MTPDKARSIAALDFLMPFIGKIPIVFLFHMMAPLLLASLVFWMLRWGGAVSAAVYWGHTASAAMMPACIYFAFAANSPSIIRKTSSHRHSKLNILFELPHPVVKDVKELQSARQTAQRVAAIAVIEAKAYTMAFGLASACLFLLWLWFVRTYDIGLLGCSARCEVMAFGLETLGSGLVFDLFNAFGIRLSDIDAQGSRLLQGVSFVAKLIFAGFVIDGLVFHFTLRRRYRNVLRHEAMSDTSVLARQ